MYIMVLLIRYPLGKILDAVPERVYMYVLVNQHVLEC